MCVGIGVWGWVQLRVRELGGGGLLHPFLAQTYSKYPFQ